MIPISISDIAGLNLKQCGHIPAVFHWRCIFLFLYHSGYVSDLIMLTRTVLRSTRLASQRRSPLGRQSIVATPTNSLSEKHI